MPEHSVHNKVCLQKKFFLPGLPFDGGGLNSIEDGYVGGLLDSHQNLSEKAIDFFQG